MGAQITIIFHIIVVHLNVIMIDDAETEQAKLNFKWLNETSIIFAWQCNIVCYGMINLFENFIKEEVFLKIVHRHQLCSCFF